ncbi:hypothetical protein HAX54_031054 [Datura stramonium]|uniref:Uncharacterized protein n=1 Tax=Datura stramonium TaxID=4076 RepID=A0ABS8V9T0_DATST|nr:hypothetical protein [Datura stramonium]
MTVFSSSTVVVDTPLSSIAKTLVLAPHGCDFSSEWSLGSPRILSCLICGNRVFKVEGPWGSLLAYPEKSSSLSSMSVRYSVDLGPSSNNIGDSLQRCRLERVGISVIFYEHQFDFIAKELSEVTQVKESGYFQEQSSIIISSMSVIMVKIASILLTSLWGI